jgi:hypothetical protein
MNPLCLGTKPALKIEEYLCASALICGGAKLLTIAPPALHSTRGRCVFHFDDQDGKATELFQKHLRGTLAVSSREMADVIQSLKSRMFALRSAEMEG